jgi:hypothetical protein
MGQKRYSMTSPKKPRKQAASAPRRYDGSGHINPEHAAQLLEIARETRESPDPKGFVGAQGSDDDLAEELGEEAVIAMTSGQDDISEERDALQEEEIGGPFVETSAAREFAPGTDESNIPGATREPFPKT